MRPARLFSFGRSHSKYNNQNNLTSRTGSPVSLTLRTGSPCKSILASNVSITSLPVISRTNYCQSLSSVLIDPVIQKANCLAKLPVSSKNSPSLSACEQTASIYEKTAGFNDTILKRNPTSIMGIQPFILGFRPKLRLAPKSCELPFCRTFMKQSESLSYTGVSLLAMKRFLRIKSIDYVESHPCLAIQVPKHICSGDDRLDTDWSEVDSSLVKFYINKTTGNFVCLEMEISGSWVQLEELITAWNKNKNSKRTDPKVDYPVLKHIDLSMPEPAKRAWDEGVPIESLTAIEFKELLRTFRQIRRDFDVEHFARFEVRVTKDHESLLFPVRYINGKMIGVRRVYMDTNKQITEDNLMDSKSSQLPFHLGMDQAIKSGSSRCVVVSSVLDAVVISARSPIPPITLADWSNLHPNHLPYFDQFDEVYFWMSDDQQQVELSRIFARKIDEKKCRLVLSEHPGALTCVRKKLDINDILASSRKCSHEFITTFDSLRHDVFLELANYEELEGVKWKRFDQLNTILKGFRRGELTVFTGKTGAGKTTFISEYSLDLCMQGVNTLWGSFEVGNIRMARMLLKQFSLVNLEEELDQFDKWADRFSKLPMYFTTFHGTAEVENVLDAMGHAVYVHDIAHIIIDNMQFMMGAKSGVDKFQLQDMVIERFRKFATLHNCHVTLVIHPRKEDEALTIHSIFGGAKATQEADNVLLLQDEQAPNSFLRKKFIQVAKNRFCGDLGVMPLHFVKPVMSFSKKANQMKKAQGGKKKVLEIEDGKKEVHIESD